MRRLLVTRPPARAMALATALRDAGFEPVRVPTVAIEPPADRSLEAALEHLDDFDWLIVTSANGVPPLAGRVPANTRIHVAAVGPATADALRQAGIRVDHIPDDYLTVAIADGLGNIDGRRILLARADAATPQLRDSLVQRGAEVSEAIAYRTLEGPPSSREPLRRALETGLDGIVFSSGSTVRGLLALLEPAKQERARSIPALCIGPVTAAQAAASGFGAAVVATDHTGIGLTRAIADHFATEAIA